MFRAKRDVSIIGERSRRSRRVDRRTARRGRSAAKSGRNRHVFVNVVSHHLRQAEI